MKKKIKKSIIEIQQKRREWVWAEWNAKRAKISKSGKTVSRQKQKKIYDRLWKKARKKFK